MGHWLAAVDETRLSRIRFTNVASTDWIIQPRSLGALSPPDVAIGDEVALFRRGRSGGIVAIGRIHEVDIAAPSATRIDKVSIFWDRLCLSNPISSADLTSLTAWWRRPYALGDFRGDLVIAVPHAAWRAMTDAFGTVRHVEWPVAWQIDPGTRVVRADVHAAYGGSRFGTVTRCDVSPNVLAFVPSEAAGARLWTDDNAYLIVGASNTDEGDLIDDPVVGHLRHGLPLRVFITDKKSAGYLGEFVIDQRKPLHGWTNHGANPLKPVRVPILRVHPLSDMPSAHAAEERSRRGTRPVRVRLAVTVEATRSRPAPAPPPDPQVKPADIHKLIQLLQSDPAATDQLLQTGQADILGELLQRRSRESTLVHLRAAVDDPECTESQLQKLLERAVWLFGGTYTGLLARRSLTVLDQVDLPLIRIDGSLHIVEIKRPNIPKLIVNEHRHLALGEAVHKAVTQVMNYLRSLDEQRAQILVDFGVDCRRATATVLIGHPRYVSGFSDVDIAETIRTYNSHLTRVQVMTYNDLISAATRALTLTTTT